MLHKFVEHIQNTAPPKMWTQGDATFALFHDGTVKELRPDTDRPDTLPLNSLDALVKLVRTEALRDNEGPLYITVPTHLHALCFGQFQRDKRCWRPVLYEVEATDVPGWDEETQLPFEQMQIALRTRFQPTPDMEYVLRLLSDITTGAKVTFNDNGVATTIVTKKGIGLQANTVIKPIVTLRPYRTFQEVEQPESTFLIRISERGIKFIEADGGMWKLRARETVKAFLETALAPEIESGSVFVAL